MSGTKPHLLTSVKNNLGATTTITYAPSTQFYLADRAAGLPWITQLPFPAQVVARVEIDEAVTGTTLVSTYRYHHGHYDGVEREFAGFGMVEQQDDATLTEGTAPPIVYTPPKLTKTWMHTGAFFDAEAVSTQYRREYSSVLPQVVPESLMPPGITPEQAREAARALRGRMLRQEVYGLDGTSLQSHPYSVTENNFAVRQLQPRATNRYGAFDVVPRETLTVHSERSPADPRREHDLTLSVDPYGNPLETLHIAYPRVGITTGPQSQTLVAYKQTDYVTIDPATPVMTSDYYRVRLDTRDAYVRAHRTDAAPIERYLFVRRGPIVCRRRTHADRGD